MKLDLKPLITETTMRLAKNNWYTFVAPPAGNKNQLREIIEKGFGVNVLAIKTMLVKGKTKRSLKGKVHRLSDWKKVMVKIKEGQKIELFDIGA
ncbi:MAG: uL23 family ribosomal protein [Microgenomates group bacterium]